FGINSIVTTACGGSATSRPFFGSLMFFPQAIARRRPYRKSVVDDGLGFLQDAAQMLRSPEALGIDLVNVFRPGRTRREPSALGYDLQPVDGSAVTRRVSEDCLNLFARQFGEFHL